MGVKGQRGVILELGAQTVASLAAHEFLNTDMMNRKQQLAHRRKHKSIITCAAECTRYRSCWRLIGNIGWSEEGGASSLSLG